MKSFYSKLLNINRWDYKIYIIFGLVFIILSMLFLKPSAIEGLVATKPKDISLNIILKDTTLVTTDPNPYGIFNVYTYIKKDSTKEELTIPYPKLKSGELNASFPFDASAAITVLKIEAKRTKDSSNNDVHKADMFPEKFTLDIMMDNEKDKYILSKESGTETGNAKNTVKPSSDLSGNEIIIVRNGEILDDNSKNIGTAYRGDSNPLNPGSKNPYILNIALKDAKNIGRIIIEYRLPDKPIDISAAIEKK
jgi:hypothetical protein